MTKQRKDGRYIFKYKDFSKKQRYLYIIRLEKPDRVPPGTQENYGTFGYRCNLENLL